MHMTQLVPDCATQMKYNAISDSSFCVLSDQVTVIGVSAKDSETIIKENIVDHSMPKVTFTANFDEVNTLAVDEVNNTLFAGSDNYGDGQVVQYDLSTGQALKNYGCVGVKVVLSSSRVGNLWMFGGFLSCKFTVIDSITRQVVNEPVKTTIKSIHSMTVFKTKEKNKFPKVLLLTFGTSPNYSKNNTDVFDITALLDMYSNLSKIVSSDI